MRVFFFVEPFVLLRLHTPEPQEIVSPFAPSHMLTVAGNHHASFIYGETDTTIGQAGADLFLGINGTIGIPCPNPPQAPNR